MCELKNKHKILQDIFLHITSSIYMLLYATICKLYASISYISKCREQYEGHIFVSGRLSCFLQPANMVDKMLMIG
jgi:hypothetical protein